MSQKRVRMGTADTVTSFDDFFVKPEGDER